MSLRPSDACILATIGSDSGLSPGRRQAIIWTDAGIWIIGFLGTNFIEIATKIHAFSFKKMRLKMSSGKWRPFCLGPNVLTRPKNYAHALKRKCLHFDEIFITGCTESCQNDNFQCSQWWKFHQNDDIFVSVRFAFVLCCDLLPVNRPISQIPLYTSPIPHNAPICNKNVHISVTQWCIAGYLSGALWDLWDGPILPLSCRVTSLTLGQ